MKYCMRKLLIGICLFILFTVCFSACENDPGALEKSGELWVVTINSGMTHLIETVSQQFQEEHQDVTIRVDICSNDAQELEQLQTQIMAGKGPDVVLFLAENISSSSLIVDVNQFMRNGHCLDLTGYYDRDTELNKDGFASAVMEVGLLDGARYVLPLRYNMPVIYADVQQLEAVGLNVDDLKNGLAGLTDAAQKLGDGAIASEYGSLYFYLYWMNLLPEMIDYEHQKLVLDETQLTDFLEEYRELVGCGIANSLPTFDAYIAREEYWALNGHSIYLGTLNSLAQNIRIAKATGIELAVLPLTTSDGSVIANVSYYGAVGANTNDPELAYSFLREFLLEENQWENHLVDSSTLLIERGWPVLTDESWSDIDTDLAAAITSITYTEHEEKVRRSSLKSVQITAEDYSLLDAQPNAVRFFPAFQWDYMVKIDGALNPAENPAAMDADVTELAEELIRELEWHVAEG